MWKDLEEWRRRITREVEKLPIVELRNRIKSLKDFMSLPFFQEKSAWEKERYRIGLGALKKELASRLDFERVS